MPESPDLPTAYIIDDHPAVQEGLRGMLEGSGLWKVLGLASSAEKARDFLLEPPHLSPLPDIILVDLNLPGQNGIDFIRDLQRARPGARPVMISVSVRFENIVESLAAGARGYLCKDQGSQAMLACLDAVRRGELGLLGEPLEILARNAVRLATAEMGLERSRYDALTPREKEVFRQTAINRSARDIAESLDLSVKTIENLKSSIFGKLDITDRFDLYRYAIRIGVLEEG
jgi:DNA-binding NarL/FixJ family response regulator